MKISMTLNPDSIDAAIRQLKQYTDGIGRKTEELRRRLASEGYLIAEQEFGSAIYDGTNDVSVELMDEQNKLIIRASGETVMFIEFGTGVTFQTYHPKREEVGVGDVGTFGHGLGRLNGGWRYRGEPGTNGTPDPKHPGYIHTYGNPANMPMYNASKEIRSRVLEIAREVFRS